MGVDDGLCEQSPDGEHDMQLDELVLNSDNWGLAQIHRCRWCGAEAYEASGADDPRRPPL